MDTKNLIIGAEYLIGEMGEIEISSPWDGQFVGKVASASRSQAEKSVEVAHEAFLSWRESSLSERVEILEKAVISLRSDTDGLANSLHREIGKFEADAKSEISRSIDYIELVIAAVKHWKGSVYAGDIDPKFPRNKKTGYYSRVPLGVILCVSPFNYPINLSITKIAPAILSGNTVVLKPATQGAYTAYAFYEHFIKAGLPKGVMNIVSGSSSEIGDALTTHPKVKLIAFTGSTKVGNHIKKISNGIPLLMELGGKDTGIVTENADIDLAVSEITKGAFSYAGQRCTAQKLVLVHASVAQQFTHKIVEAVRTLELNPMIDEQSADYVMELYTDAVSSGAVTLLAPTKTGNKMTQGVISNVNPNMRVFKEEQFGPLLPIVIYENEHQAIDMANSSDFGLQASVYSTNINQAFKIADKLEVGTVQINGKPDRGPDNFPFGGVKDSGQLMQGTIESLELMTRGKLTVLNLTV